MAQEVVYRKVNSWGAIHFVPYAVLLRLKKLLKSIYVAKIDLWCYSEANCITISMIKTPQTLTFTLDYDTPNFEMKQ